MSKVWKFAATILVMGLVFQNSALADTPVENERSHRVNFRVGAASSDTVGRPTMCLEVVPWSSLSIEGCGTGSGLLYKEGGQQIAHFRAKWMAWNSPWLSGLFRVQPGVGFAELEVGNDELGFSFGGASRELTSTAGPEMSTSVSYLAPLGARFEFIAEATLGAAYFAHASALNEPRNETQLFASVEIGVGF